MTPHEERWRQTFLDAYKHNTGDARRLALNEAWFNFVSSDDALKFYDLRRDSLYPYWTALVDAAHVDQESEVVMRLISASFPNEESAVGYGNDDRAKEEFAAKGIYIGGGGGAANPDQPPYVTNGQHVAIGAVGFDGAGGGTDHLVAKMQEFLAKEGEAICPYRDASLKKWIGYFGGTTPKRDKP